MGVKKEGADLGGGINTLLSALNARWALPVYPVFEDEKSNASDEKSVKQKIALKKTFRKN